jgi:hypothetical protein
MGSELDLGRDASEGLNHTGQLGARTPRHFIYG